MGRMTRVELHGFKGQTRHYDLGAATALVGPMGAGKSSCMDAIRYALTGEVGKDDKADAKIAPWFSPVGGTVVVQDAEGNWLKRGIAVDLGRGGKITRILDSSSTPMGAKQTDVSLWQSNPVLLSPSQFADMSPEEKRREILRICGATEEPSVEKVLEAIALEYVREIGGRAAETSWLYDETKWKLFDPPESHGLEFWGKRGGIFERLQAQCAGSSSAMVSTSTLCAKLTEVCGKEKYAARKEAAAARDATGELEAPALKAEAIASRLEEFSTRLVSLRAIQTSIAEREARRNQLIEDIAAAERAVTHARQALDEQEKIVQAAAKSHEDAIAQNQPTPLPKKPAMPDMGRNLDLQMRVDDLAKELRASEQAITELATAREEESRWIEHRKESGEYEIREILDLMDPSAWPDEAFRSQNSMCARILKFATEALSKVEKHLEAGRRRMDRARAEIQRLEPIAAKLDQLKKEHEAATLERDQNRKLADAAMDSYRAATMEYEVALSGRDRQMSAIHEAKATLEKAKAKLDACGARVEESGKAVARLKKSHDDFIAENEGEDMLSQSEVARLIGEVAKSESEARDAAACVKAYKDAQSRLATNLKAEYAWKIAEIAAKRARDVLVFDAAAPIVQDANRVLDVTGRPERVFVTLENQRGVPTFEMGLTRGDQRIGFAPMSGGESTIFLCAIAVAIALRSTGHRIILVEADKLDEIGLKNVFESLVHFREQITFVLCTSRDVPIIDGWEYRWLDPSNDEDSRPKLRKVENDDV